MAWGKDGGNQQGPWGKPQGGGWNTGGGSGGGGGGRNTPPPQGPDFDALLRKSQEKLRKAVGGGSGGDKRVFIFIAAAVAALWLVSGIYLVKADEQGVVLRFGQFNRVTPPGIGYRLPAPFESVVTPKVTLVNRIEIGFRTGYSGRNTKGAPSVPEESLMLTGDENIVDLNLEVQWKIAKAEDFLFNVRNPEETVKAVAESAIREVIGRTTIAKVLAEGKLGTEQAAMEIATKKLVQDTLDSYKAGVEIVSINLLGVNPPAQAIDAFRDVQTARADKETAINQAEAYSNDILPRASGDAQKMVLDAEAYKQEVVARAEGEAARFAAVYAEYKQAKDVTRKRMYLETMEEIMRGVNKVIMDKAGAGVVPYLPMSELKPKPAAEAKP